MNIQLKQQKIELLKFPGFVEKLLLDLFARLGIHTVFLTNQERPVSSPVLSPWFERGAGGVLGLLQWDETDPKPHPGVSTGQEMVRKK